jgi:hypothetical protein
LRERLRVARLSIYSLAMRKPATCAALLLPALACAATGARADAAHRALTVYAARISSEATWQHVLKDPLGTGFVDSYLVAAALAQRYASFLGDGLALEAEGQAVYHFGEQNHWEFNAMPVVARWQRFPWSGRFASSAAFGLGLSYATEVPAVELRLEDTSDRLMIYWVAELTAGPRDARWAISLRLHHRSDAFGLMGEDGGMNAVGLGIRYGFVTPR